MEFGEAIETCMNKYATFTGRASRSEFWWFMLFMVLVSGAISAIENLSWVAHLIDVIFLLPFFAAGTRRLQDTGRSGWWQLLYLTGIGFIVVWIMLCGKSEQHTNAYGPPCESTGKNQTTPTA